MKLTGQILKKNREAKGLSISEVALATKINARALQAIEEGDVNKLPQKSFLRGFVRSYASFLKLEIDKVMETFQEEMGTTTPVVAKADGENNESLARKPPRLGETPLTSKTLAVAGILVLIGLIISVKRVVEKYERESQQPKPTEVTELVKNKRDLPPPTGTGHKKDTLVVLEKSSDTKFGGEETNVVADAGKDKSSKDGKSAEEEEAKAQEQTEKLALEKKALEEKEIAEAKAQEEKKAAEEKAQKEKELAEAKAQEEKKAAEEKAQEEKELAEAQAQEEKILAVAKAQKEKKAAEEKAEKKKKLAEAKAAEFKKANEKKKKVADKNKKETKEERDDGGFFGFITKAFDRRDEKKEEEKKAQEELKKEEKTKELAQQKKAKEEKLAANAKQQKVAIEKKKAQEKMAKEAANSEKPKESTTSITQEIIIESLDSISLSYKIDAGENRKIKLNPGQLHIFKGSQKIALELSDGGTVNVIYNGIDQGVPGVLGKPIKLNYPK